MQVFEERIHEIKAKTYAEQWCRIRIGTRSIGRRNRTVVLLCCGALLLVLSSGCGGSRKPWENVYPAAGQVKFAGRPIGGAQLTFYPKDKSVPATIRPTATTEVDGSFEVGTFGTDDGAPAGEYDVTVTWRPLIGEGSALSPGPNQLPARYSNPESSQLKVVVERGADKTILPALELNP